MSTIREMLTRTFDPETVENIERHGKGTPYDLLESECGTAGFATYRDGLLLTVCRGTAIMWFRPSSTTRRELLLCVDDLDKEAWLFRRRSGESGPGGLPGGKSCPPEVLTLVQTA